MYLYALPKRAACILCDRIAQSRDILQRGDIPYENDRCIFGRPGRRSGRNYADALSEAVYAKKSKDAAACRTWYALRNVRVKQAAYAVCFIKTIISIKIL